MKTLTPEQRIEGFTELEGVLGEGGVGGAHLMSFLAGIAHAEKVLAEPKQDEEPVAWVIPGGVTKSKDLAEANGNNAKPLYLYPAQRPEPEPEPEQEQEQLELIGELHPNGLVDFVNDEIPIHHVFPVKLYAKGEALINEIAKCNSDILLGKDHPAPRSDFVRLSEEEIFGLVPKDYMEVIEFARAIEDALEKKNK